MHEALLLLGPTGSGKTPLGLRLEVEGLGGRPARHFDFGAALRAAAGGEEGGLDPRWAAVARDAVGAGRLLEDRELPVARALLGAFLARLDGGERPLVVLNGLPRHVGQARDLEGVVDVRSVACLHAPGDVVLARIRGDVGGDRAGRTDDDAAGIARRLERFRARTLPLIAHYEHLGARILPLEVGARTTARDLHARLAAAWAR